jgi:phosphosulfolactate synthase
MTALQAYLAQHPEQATELRRVLVEANERDFLIANVLGRLDMSRVMIELPGPWISGVTLHQVYDMRKLLVKAFGPDVNIANVKPDDVFDTEALRVGLGVVGPQLPAN